MCTRWWASYYGRAFDVLLVRFALERLLYRLSISDHKERFVLKGGMLVTALIDDDNRVTRDADFRAIMMIECEDGLQFDIEALDATAIREEMEYGGIRLKTAAYLQRTRIPVTINIGFGDAMADASQRIDYPTLLDFPAPHIRVYPPVTVIAEKFQAMDALGVLNGRMKDYYDLWAIPSSLDIAPEELDAAIPATFDRRGTVIPSSRPPGLLSEMLEDEAKQPQWRAYAASIEIEGVNLDAVLDAVGELVGPSCERLLSGMWRQSPFA